MRTADLIAVLTHLRKRFPTLQRISTYGRAGSMMRKSAEEMEEIADAGLNMLYSGIESGADEVLQLVNKGVSQQQLIDSSRRARAAGMSIMVFVILGLGGRQLSGVHVRETAKVLNAINPNSVRVMTLAVKQQTGLWPLIASGEFSMLSEAEMVAEQRRLVALLEGINCHYGNFHGINLLTEVDGVLPDDKAKLLGIMDAFLALPKELQNNYVLGRRMHRYGRLSEFQNSSSFATVQAQLEQLQGERELEEVFHLMRNQII